MRTYAAILGVFLLTTNSSLAQPASQPAYLGDSAAIQQQIDKKADQGGTVRLKAGRYKLDAPIMVREGVTLAGVWETPHQTALNHGTVFEVFAGKGDENAKPLINLVDSSAVKGITFYYPEQRVPDVIPYPWTIQGRGRHGTVLDCTFVNSYKAVDFGTYLNELHHIRNCYGCPLRVGLHIDQCSDIGRIENVHWNPNYWGAARIPGAPKNGPILKYLFDNFVAFEFARSDWEYVLNTFCYGAKVGYRFYNGTAGISGGANGNFLGIGADWCRRTVLVEDCQSPGLLITNGEFVGGEGTDAMMEIASTNHGVVQLSNCAFWGPAPMAAIVAGKGFASFSQCNFINHGQRKPGDHTLEVRGGNIIVQGCRFSVDMPDVRLGEDVQSAIITGNWFKSAKEIHDESKLSNLQDGMNITSQIPGPPPQ